MNNEEPNVTQDSIHTVPPSSEPQPSVPQMRTFSTDLADELRKHQGSAMKIAVMENERRMHEEELSLNDPKKNMLLILGGVFMVFVALGIVIGIYLYQRKENAPLPPEPVVPSSVIKSENFTVLNVSGKQSEDIAASIRELVSKSTTQTGMIDSVYITEGASSTEKRISSSAFLGRIDSHASKEFVQSLSANYMVGVYSYNTPHLFVALSGPQHDALLAGMFQWESYLLDDMAPLFGIDTTGNNAYLLNAPFSGMLIENHDVRAVLDHDNKPILFYSFLDPDTILITTDSKTLTEAVRRLMQ